MVYKVIGLMSGSSLDGLDIAYVHLQENRGKWEFEFIRTDCYPYPPDWRQRLLEAPGLNALDYMLLHTAYGRYLGEQVNRFIAAHDLAYKVQLIASHGHTTFHLPQRKGDPTPGMTGQLGDGAAIAAVTGINVVSDLRAMDIALGGQGAPIVPIGERLLLSGYDLFLNLGGIANISSRISDFLAFDVCPANRILDSLAALAGQSYDAGGALAATGRPDQALLDQLNALDYYRQSYPKSLANDFGTGTVLPMITRAGLSIPDALRTYTEHIVGQIAFSVDRLLATAPGLPAEAQPSQPAQPAPDKSAQAPAPDAAASPTSLRLLATGGGAKNAFLIGRLQEVLRPLGVNVEVPDQQLADYKEALVMALMGVLRWREENNALASVTGARRDSIGGAVWIGQEA